MVIDDTITNQVHEIFGETGLLSQGERFEYRPEQQQMAVAVAEALESGRNLIVEAGTGVGKSLGYLVPSILFAVERRKKAVICTHTINLQEQLTEKDLPHLQKTLPINFDFAMLSGRANYLCTLRLHRALEQHRELFSTEEAEELKRIAEWSKTTETGHVQDMEREPNPKVWAMVCSERGNCTSKKCGHGSAHAEQHGVCFFQQAKQRIKNADVLVLNHALFFAILKSQQDPIENGLLFKNDFVVFDEAHTVEAVAAEHIGSSVSVNQVKNAIHRLWNPTSEKGILSTMRQGDSVRKVAELMAAAEQFFRNLEQACDRIAPRDRAREQWLTLRIKQPDLVQDNLTPAIDAVRLEVKTLIQRSQRRQFLHGLFTTGSVAQISSGCWPAYSVKN